MKNYGDRWWVIFRSDEDFCQVTLLCSMESAGSSGVPAVAREVRNPSAAKAWFRIAKVFTLPLLGLSVSANTLAFLIFDPICAFLYRDSP